MMAKTQSVVTSCAAVKTEANQGVGCVEGSWLIYARHFGPSTPSFSMLRMRRADRLRPHQSLLRWVCICKQWNPCTLSWPEDWLEAKCSGARSNGYAAVHAKGNNGPCTFKLSHGRQAHLHSFALLFALPFLSDPLPCF